MRRQVNKRNRIESSERDPNTYTEIQEIIKDAPQISLVKMNVFIQSAATTGWSYGHIHQNK